MSVIFLLIPLSIVIAAGFLGAFIWAVRSGQYDDTCTPSLRLLLEDARIKSEDKPAPVTSEASCINDAPPEAGEVPASETRRLNGATNHGEQITIHVECRDAAADSMTPI